MFGSGFYLLLNLNYLTVQVTLQHLQTMQCNWLAYIYKYIYMYVHTHIYAYMCMYIYITFFTYFCLIFLHEICCRMTCRVGVIRDVRADMISGCN